MDYRKDAGEKITEESWLMQNLRDVTTPTGKGLATVPGKLKPSGIDLFYSYNYNFLFCTNLNYF
jgi:hypothetical protein